MIRKAEEALQEGESLGFSRMAPCFDLLFGDAGIVD